MTINNTTIYFDMDGTIADLYGVENWLDSLIAEDTRPYDIAKGIVNLSQFARLVNELQKSGYRIGIISWTSKGGSNDYNRAVKESKKRWLAKHLASVKFDEINVVPYGTPKRTVATTENAILFDDEDKNLTAWGEGAIIASMMMTTLKAMRKGA